MPNTAIQAPLHQDPGSKPCPRRPPMYSFSTGVSPAHRLRPTRSRGESAGPKNKKRKVPAPKVPRFSRHKPPQQPTGPPGRHDAVWRPWAEQPRHEKQLSIRRRRRPRVLKCRSNTARYGPAQASKQIEDPGRVVFLFARRCQRRARFDADLKNASREEQEGGRAQAPGIPQFAPSTKTEQGQPRTVARARRNVDPDDRPRGLASPPQAVARSKMRVGSRG